MRFRVRCIGTANSERSSPIFGPVQVCGKQQVFQANYRHSRAVFIRNLQMLTWFPGTCGRCFGGRENRGEGREERGAGSEKRGARGRERGHSLTSSRSEESLLAMSVIRSGAGRTWGLRQFFSGTIPVV